MNHKELVRIIYNEMLNNPNFSNLPSHSCHAAATRAAKEIQKWIDIEQSLSAFPLTEGYQPRGTGAEYAPNPPGTPRRAATSASMSHDSHGRPTYTAVDHAGNIWTKLADGVWNKQPPLPQD